MLKRGLPPYIVVERVLRKSEIRIPLTDCSTALLSSAIDAVAKFNDAGHVIEHVGVLLSALRMEGPDSLSDAITIITQAFNRGIGSSGYEI